MNAVVDRWRRAYGRIAVIVFSLLLGLLFFEGFAGLALSLRVNSGMQRWHSISYYDDQAWADVLWEESAFIFETDPVEYHPYVIWRRIPFNGETIQVDARGLRTTPGSDCSPDAYTIFTFGGSTMWGFGSPDWMTIPAWMHTELTGRTDQAVCIVNFGEPAFVTTQDIIQLTLELQRGHVPDLVVFLDGVNDVVAGYQNGSAGGHHNEDRFRAILDNSDHPLRLALETSNIAEVFRILTPAGPAAAGSGTEVSEPQLALEIGQVYLANTRIISHLADGYGFDYLVVLQPHLTTGEKNLTDEEAALASRVDPRLAVLMRAAYQAIQAAPPDPAHFADLTGIFDDTEFLVWIDDIHLTGEGNRIIAEAIAARIPLR